MNAQDRTRAHAQLDRWLEECEREIGPRLAGGEHGHIGTLKLSAWVNGDAELSLTIERSIELDL